MAKDAIEGYLESMREEGWPMLGRISSVKLLSLFAASAPAVHLANGAVQMRF